MEWGDQIGEVTYGGFAPHLSCKRDQIKMTLQSL